MHLQLQPMERVSVVEDRENEVPPECLWLFKNVFDQTVRRYFSGGLRAPVVGLKYF